ncbi:hypothetical protein BD311DRAFT_654992 [Dichomitus squalens]|uniref:Uncharacterized protein n=1 Tax=Dichomitus squalens TaxID=114155 RepID=A0A4Q9MXK9_9APHY|nr:hypothetical protein BD311DRAFT_654992 [Dichomitus squalens]
MCHRQLRLWKAKQCGHLTFIGETNIDCRSRDCYNSSAHPRDCGAPGTGTACRCRRYYTCVLPVPSSRLRGSPTHTPPLQPARAHNHK